MLKTLTIAVALSLANIAIVACGHAQPPARSSEVIVIPHAAENAQEGSTIRPYAHAGEGDNDGLSRDPDGCNKGCIDGNPN